MRSNVGEEKGMVRLGYVGKRKEGKVWGRES